MYKEKTIVVVVPAYNEQVQIHKVITAMPPFIDKIVVVDDASKDNTLQVIEEIQKIDSKVVLIKHEKNQGVGGAIATGYKWARDNNFDVAVVMAGDGQMDPANLPILLDPVVKNETDYSKANRLTSGKAYKKIPKIRYIGNSVLTLLTKIASGYWHVIDSQTGYTAINKKALHTIGWDSMYKRYGQPNDLLVKLNVFGFRVKDVPMEPVYNVGERSQMRVLKVMFSISWLLLKLFFWRLKEKYIIRDFHPLVLFYFLTFVLLLVSFLLFARIIFVVLMLHYIPHMSVLAFMFSITMSMQTGFFAMWMDSNYGK